MWNPWSASRSEFYDVLNDEAESGSELGSDWDDVDDDEHLICTDEEDDYEAVQEPMDIECIQVLTEGVGPLNSLDCSTLDSPVEAVPSTSRASLPSHTVTSRNTDLGQESNVVLFYSEDGEPSQVDQDWSPRASSVSLRGRSRGQPRSRGTRRQGANRGRGTAVRSGGRWRGVPSARAVSADYRRQHGSIVEVCLDDEDVPPELRQLVHELTQNRARQSRRHEQERRQAPAADEDEFDESTVVSELFGGDESALNFEWSPMSTFNGSRCPFEPGFQVGPTQRCSDAYSAFRQFWDDEILEHIVRETNRYAVVLKEQSQRFAKDWYDTNVHEILILLTFWMMLGIIRMPSIKSCFSYSHLLKTDIFRALMTQSRYWILNRALHLVDNGTRTADSSKLFCLGPIADHLNKKFKECYNPGQDISIDESLTLWKGKVSFRQYIKSKAARFGIKTFELCESSTGYLWSFTIYQGKDMTNTSSLPKSMEVVVRLIRPLLNKGYRVFMDSAFNSPILARFLKRNNTDCVGTLRKYRTDVPPLIKVVKIPEGTVVARHSGDVAVMVYQDKNTVYTISTHHNTDVTHIRGKPGRPAHYRPTVIADYNANMGGVDRKDQMVEPYLIERKRCQKWYKKMFKRFLNVSIFNSHIIYEKSFDRNNQTKQISYRLDLVEQIMHHHLAHVPLPRKPTTTVKISVLPPTRLIGKHFIIRGEVDDQKTEGAARNSKSRRYCVWCTYEKRRSRTVWLCDNCGVPLCLEGCFKKYHT